MNALLLTLLLVLQGGPAPDGGTLTGRLLSPAKSPLASVRIALSPGKDSSELVAITQTNNDGRYRFENVPAGSYYIVAGRVNAATYSAAPIAVTARSTVQAPDLELSATSGGLTVKGRVTMEGIPLGQAPAIEIRLNGTVSAGAAGTARVQVSTNIARDGSFQIPSVPPGRYNVMFFPDVVGARAVDIDRDVDDLQLTIPLASWLVQVDGTVKVDGIAPIPSAGFTLINTTGAGAERRAGFFAETFTMSLINSGEYRFQVRDLPPGYFVISVTAGAVNLLTEPLVVHPVQLPKIAITLGVSQAIPGVRVIGRLTDIERSLRPTGVHLVAADRELRLLAPVEPDGSFTFPLVPAGTHKVELTPKVDAMETTRTLTIGTDDPTQVEVPVKIAALRRILVTMIDRPRNSFFPYMELPGPTFIRATVAGSGAYQFLNVKPGTYQLFVADQGPTGPRVLPAKRVTVVVADEDVTVQLSGR
jgi:hypothetical protein